MGFDGSRCEKLRPLSTNMNKISMISSSIVFSKRFREPFLLSYLYSYVLTTPGFLIFTISFAPPGPLPLVNHDQDPMLIRLVRDSYTETKNKMNSDDKCWQGFCESTIN